MWLLGHGTTVSETQMAAQKELGGKMKKLLQKFVRDDQGQDLIEYAFLAAFIALSAVLLIQAIGTSLNTIYTNVNDQLDNAAQNPT